MKVEIRQLTIDTGDQADLVLVAAQLTQIARAWMASEPARRPEPNHIILPAATPVTAIAPPTDPPQGERSSSISPLPPGERSGPDGPGVGVRVNAGNGHKPNGQARRTSSKVKLTNLCGCGRSKLVTSERCRRCAAIHARANRKRGDAA